MIRLELEWWKTKEIIYTQFWVFSFYTVLSHKVSKKYLKFKSFLKTRLFRCSDKTEFGTMLDAIVCQKVCQPDLSKTHFWNLIGSEEVHTSKVGVEY